MANQITGPELQMLEKQIARQRTIEAGEAVGSPEHTDATEELEELLRMRDGILDERQNDETKG
jgi:hypothetical protein